MVTYTTTCERCGRERVATADGRCPCDRDRRLWVLAGRVASARRSAELFGDDPSHLLPPSAMPEYRRLSR